MHIPHPHSGNTALHAAVFPERPVAHPIFLSLLLVFLLFFNGCGSQPIRPADSGSGLPVSSTGTSVVTPDATPDGTSDGTPAGTPDGTLSGTGNPTPVPSIPSDPGGEPMAQHIPDNVQEMSLQEKIGQMMFPAFRTNGAGLPLLSADEALLQALRTRKPGGVVLFAQNLSSVPQTAALIRQLQAESAIPLFVGVDEEGGLVSRLSAAKGLGAVTMPSAFTIGLTGEESLAYESAVAIARQLSVLGFNLDFAPVADVHTNPNNPVIGRRAYGTTPELVSRMIASAIEGFREEGILPVAKHFPGHGDTQTDSHLGLAVVPHNRTRMDEVELAPFRTAISADIPMIMTAHVNTPGISERDLPATLNPDILTDLLRNELGYDGLILTDAMEMGAITEHYGEAESIVMAVEAGADMLLVPVSLDRACEALLNAVNSGRVSEARIDASVQRILDLKRAWRLLEKTRTVMADNPQTIPDTDTYRELVARIKAAAGE